MRIVNSEAHEDFTVSDGVNMITGISNVEFVKNLYAPDSSSSILPVTISELGDGHYRASFTPDSEGSWYLVVVHTIHFPWGKSADIIISGESSLTGTENTKLMSLPTLSEIESSSVLAKQSELLRTLGLVQENQHMDEFVYDDVNGASVLSQCRMRTYSNSVDVGSDNSVTATYRVMSQWDGDNLIDYKVLRE